MLEHGNVQLIESLVISEYVAEAFADVGTALMPTGPQARARVRLFIDMWGKSINYFSLLRATTDEAKQEALQALVKGLGVVDCALQKSPSSGPYLCDDFTLAEVCTAPFVQRMLVLLPAVASVDPLEICRTHGYSRARDWMMAVSERPSCVSSLPPSSQLIDGYQKMVARFAAMAATKSG